MPTQAIAATLNVWRGALLLAAVALMGAAVMPTESPEDVIAGEYLVAIGGCNDCHTANWNHSPGQIPPAQRLTGSPVGWHGPWGTSYAVNLRLLMRRMTQDAWVTYVANMQPKPPMPWYNMRVMKPADLRAIYAYIHSLGPAGEAMPDDLPPGETPKTAYIEAVPRTP